MFYPIIFYTVRRRLMSKNKKQDWRTARTGLFFDGRRKNTVQE
jgi:hypothetical protein